MIILSILVNKHENIQHEKVIEKTFLLILNWQAKKEDFALSLLKRILFDMLLVRLLSIISTLI